MPTTAPVHPVFEAFPCWAGDVPAGVKVNFLGVRTREEYTTFLPQHECERTIETQYPPPCEDYFEYIDVLEAVCGARGSFAMVELGAGYGRWLVNAAVALQHAQPDLPCRLIGVEAEPTHFRWMREHMIANGLDPDTHMLVEGAVAATDGQIEFVSGRADDWYAQAIATPQFVDRLERDGMLASGQHRDGLRVSRVPAWSLATLLHDIEFVDLLDIDIQGAEFEVLDAAQHVLHNKVARVHIGTHGREIEAALRTMFDKLAWEVVHDYPCQSSCDTPYGEVDFEDGVQTWRNPRLADRAGGESRIS